MEDGLFADAFRRLYIHVSGSRIFKPDEAGSVSVYAELGSARTESEAQAASMGMSWNWRAELELTSSVTHCVLGVSRKRFMGGPEHLGQALVPLAPLRDQRAHALALTLSRVLVTLPGAQGAHAAVETVEYRPGSQPVQLLPPAAPSVSVTFPAGHDMQASAEAEPLAAE